MYKCTLCKQTFSSKKAMESHIRNHSSSDIMSPLDAASSPSLKPSSPLGSAKAASPIGGMKNVGEFSSGPKSISPGAFASSMTFNMNSSSPGLSSGHGAQNLPPFAADMNFGMKGPSPPPDLGSTRSTGAFAIDLNAQRKPVSSIEQAMPDLGYRMKSSPMELPTDMGQTTLGPHTNFRFIPRASSSTSADSGFAGSTLDFDSDSEGHNGSPSIQPPLDHSPPPLPQEEISFGSYQQNQVYNHLPTQTRLNQRPHPYSSVRGYRYDFPSSEPYHFDSRPSNTQHLTSQSLPGRTMGFPQNRSRITSPIHGNHSSIPALSSTASSRIPSAQSSPGSSGVVPISMLPQYLPYQN